MLCTLTDVKLMQKISVSDTEFDDFLTQQINYVSHQLALAAGRSHGGRACLEMAARTVTLNVLEPRTQMILLPAWPVVSITEIKEALYGAFDDATALTVNTDYQLDAGLGMLYRVGYWLKGTQTVRVTLSGGYTRADHWASGSDYVAGDRVQYLEGIYDCILAATGETTIPLDDATHWTLATGEIPLPDDIAGAAIKQVSFNFQRRGELGLSAAGVQGGSFNAYAKDDLLPEVKDIMDGYRRKMA